MPDNDSGGGWGLVAPAVFKTVFGALTRPGWVRFLHAPATTNSRLLRFLPRKPFAFVLSKGPKQGPKLIDATWNSDI